MNQLTKQITSAYHPPAPGKLPPTPVADKCRLPHAAVRVRCNQDRPNRILRYHRPVERLLTSHQPFNPALHAVATRLSSCVCGPAHRQRAAERSVQWALPLTLP